MHIATSPFILLGTVYGILNIAVCHLLPVIVFRCLLTCCCRFHTALVFPRRLKVARLHSRSKECPWANTIHPSTGPPASDPTHFDASSHLLASRISVPSHDSPCALNEVGPSRGPFSRLDEPLSGVWCVPIRYRAGTAVDSLTFEPSTRSSTHPFSTRSMALVRLKSHPILPFSGEIVSPSCASPTVRIDEADEDADKANGSRR